MLSYAGVESWVSSHGCRVAVTVKRRVRFIHLVSSHLPTLPATVLRAVDCLGRKRMSMPDTNSTTWLIKLKAS